jgi:porin
LARAPDYKCLKLTSTALLLFLTVPVASASAEDLPYSPSDLRIRGLLNPVPDPLTNTLDPDPNGLRTALAKLGIGYFGSVQGQYQNDLNPNADKTTNGFQAYNGQRATYNVSTKLVMTYDLRQYGIPDGQMVWGISSGISTYDGPAPNQVNLNSAYYYQTMFDRKVELKIGYLNGSQFVGYVGGNFADNILGPNNRIDGQGGAAPGFFATSPTPGIVVKTNFTKDIYWLSTIQRSTSPDGNHFEFLYNRNGLAFTVPNAGVLAQNELDYRHLATAGSNELWIRGGASYNDSNYKSQAVPGVRIDNNSWFYAAGDYQFWQSNPSVRAGSGIYAGFTVMYAPPKNNTVTQSYQARLYSRGPLASRPDDLLAFVVSNLAFSPYTVTNLVVKPPFFKQSTQTSYTVSYNAHVAPGVYGLIGVSYIDNPSGLTALPTTGHAVLFNGQMTFYF